MLSTWKQHKKPSVNGALRISVRRNNWICNMDPHDHERHKKEYNGIITDKFRKLLHC